MCHPEVIREVKAIVTAGRGFFRRRRLLCAWDASRACKGPDAHTENLTTVEKLHWECLKPETYPTCRADQDGT